MPNAPHPPHPHPPPSPHHPPPQHHLIRFHAPPSTPSLDLITPSSPSPSTPTPRCSFLFCPQTRKRETRARSPRAPLSRSVKPHLSFDQVTCNGTLLRRRCIRASEARWQRAGMGCRARPEGREEVLGRSASSSLSTSHAKMIDMLIYEDSCAWPSHGECGAPTATCAGEASTYGVPTPGIGARVGHGAAGVVAHDPSGPQLRMRMQARLRPYRADEGGVSSLAHIGRTCRGSAA